MISILGFAETHAPREERDEAELVNAVVRGALADAGVRRQDVGFWCSGSCDYLCGRPFSFVTALDGLGLWPPAAESHVEMDGAWALYEAWVHLLAGHGRLACVYAFGRASITDPERVLAMQLDPYCVAPLGVTPATLAALQARILRDRGVEISGGPGPPTDGAAAMVIGLGPGKAWIRGMDHRVDPHALGARDLGDAPSFRLAAENAGAHAVDLAEIHAPYPGQEEVLRRAFALPTDTRADGPTTPMVAGLSRIGRAASRVGPGRRALAHACSGPCLQQNLVCVLEGA